MKGYLDNELNAKGNPSAERPVKKARGGIASRKAKVNSMAAHSGRSKPGDESVAIPAEETPHTTTPSKAGDIGFVLNGPSSSPPSQVTPLKRPKSRPAKQQQEQKPSAPKDDEIHGFAAAEPAHNRVFTHLLD